MVILSNNTSFHTYIIFVEMFSHSSPDLPSATKITKNLLSQIMEFKSRLPVVSCLLNPSLRFRHWDAISEVLDGDDIKLTKDMSVSVTDLVELKVRK